MNIAVINIKGIIKYALKLGMIICLIYICIHIINRKTTGTNQYLKREIGDGVQRISNKNYLECLDTSLSLFSYKKTDKNKFQILSNTQILALEMEILDKSILESTDLLIDESNLTVDDVEELANQIEKISENAITEEVQENNITAKYTTEYGNVKINNQSKYEMTEEILKPDAEITNKKDILIYHTHTCESYTPSQRI